MVQVTVFLGDLESIAVDVVAEVETDVLSLASLSFGEDGADVGGKCTVVGSVDGSWWLVVAGNYDFPGNTQLDTEGLLMNRELR
ncbi:unnamed protein product [Nippostrongylus brasiliensis]|uniref:TerD domain-containing protein n=1 Tax=Nippostrongylus brasiliensis TaxID=27835 RepID=A0A0N4XZM5_NIPBR|nr:unnamed protein product [Nippostrongylus brasiliensis]